ncbi:MULTISPECIES: helix-turn-helix transcriptional regulator [Agrococcus]|uniref:HTH cro/C1-type domain-containing protein n=1 Tax=Agrococcus pavilionensis RW1 TaxID=1330458 RepID=U1MS03_9MICO|nr:MULTISPECIES: helix-turn-helix transcriptional regulator [Agrococcus]ERG63450.1 hypothetical protein L332_03165 [Agrococcus pavilionensis RW1]MBO1769057.1 helix-turn-helix transcriptional regulator [Agrococcus sp. TF02-05]
MDRAQVERNLVEQAALYGAPLAELLAPVRESLGMTQARLAQAMGLSAPMLSQLLQGQRVKIGNPVVLARMDALIALEADARAGLPAAEVARRAQEIAASTVRSTHAGAPAEALRDALLAIAPRAELEAAIEQLRTGYPRVADGLAALLAGPR